MVTEAMVEAALTAWHKDWTEGPPEQDERSAMRAALSAALADAQGTPEWRSLLTEARNEIDHYADTAKTLDLVNRITAALAASPVPDA